MWCIKAWNAPINQGNIDVAVLAAQATENNQGTAKVATDAQMLDGANDQVISHAEKTTQGAFQSVSGRTATSCSHRGLAVLFCSGNVVVGATSAAFTFPIEFPAALYTVTEALSAAPPPRRQAGGNFSRFTHGGNSLRVGHRKLYVPLVCTRQLRGSR